MNKVKMVRFNKISWKLTLFYAGIFLIILIALSAGIIYGIRFYLMQEAFNTVVNSSTITAENIADTISDRDNQTQHELSGDATSGKHSLTDPELLSEATANSDIDIAIADENGNIVSQSGNSKFDVKTNLGVTQEVQNGSSHAAVRNQAILVNGQVKGYLQVTLNLSDDYSFLRILIFAIVFADCVGLILSLFLGNLVSRRMLKPIDNITKTAKEISFSGLNQKIEYADNDDELSRLAGTFNDMIERLRISFEKQNAFVSDASHELRTPISVIRGYIDVIDGWGKDDRVVLDEAIAAIQNETYHMENLVEKLLFLARSDTGRLNIKTEKFNLGDLADEIISEYNLIYPGRLIKSTVKPDTVLTADIRLIKQALRALIDNGIKFSPDNSEIDLSAKKSNHEITISVKDRGIGIPKDRIGNIFDRFFRIDSARNRKTGGMGLGLSIVQIIINAHGGKIDVESKPGHGTVMSIKLPQKNTD